MVRNLHEEASIWCKKSVRVMRRKDKDHNFVNRCNLDKLDTKENGHVFKTES